MFAVMLDQTTAAAVLAVLDAHPEHSALRDRVWDALIDARNREAGTRWNTNEKRSQDVNPASAVLSHTPKT